MAMWRRLVVVVLWMGFSLTTWAQSDEGYSIPDYNEIEKLTQDKNSMFYYENLLSRYNNHDTTLTLRDYRMLYFGAFFQDNYKPFFQTPQADSIKILLSTNSELRDEHWKEMVRLGTANLHQNPFDLKGINIVWVADRQLGDSANANIYFDKLRKLVQTILATGDGLSEKTAFHVLNVAHEYDIINILGYEFAGDQQLTDSHCDYLTLKSNDDNLEGLYFDVKQVFKGYERTLTGY